ncbi:uncharacterized protein G2W53_032738 [Senna tora]|uniref:Uncharacterized protein n=1 Tax=Senna tora TaxID=362788 RepID=A0A834W777_9FABA|nr:uncharacterized protein G2W53_032738 [Senna tora]
MQCIPHLKCREEVLVLTHNVIFHAAKQQDTSHRVLSLPRAIRLCVPSHLLSRTFPTWLNNDIPYSLYHFLLL